MRILFLWLLSLCVWIPSFCLAEDQNDFARAVQAVKDKEYQLAVDLFETEAKKSEYEAQYNLALLLQAGKGRPQNYMDALYWALLAHLGGIHQADRMVHNLQDRLGADELELVFTQTAQTLLDQINAGTHKAIPQFAHFHAEITTDSDYSQAYIWYSIAVAFGLPDVIEYRNNMEARLDASALPHLQRQSHQIFTRLRAGEKIALEMDSQK